MVRKYKIELYYRAVVLVLGPIFAVACTQGRFEVHSNCGFGAPGCAQVESATPTPTSKAAKLSAVNCVDPDLSKVIAGTQITLCNGTVGVGTYVVKSNCAKDGDTGCLTTTSFPAADTSSLSADKIMTGTTVAGIVGTKRQTIICKNGQGIKQDNGTSTTSWDGTMSTMAGTVTIGSGSTTVTGAGTNFTIEAAVGQQITISGQTRTVASITSGTVLNVDSNWTSAAGPGAAYKISVPYQDLTVDDYQNNASPWYKGASHTNCNETNFTDVTNTASNLYPDASKDSHWTKIYQDILTGTYFTNTLYSMAKDNNQAVDLCVGLNGGTGGSGWRLPTEKELVQIHIDGASKLIGSGLESGSDYFWTSTTHSLWPWTAWAVRPGTGDVAPPGGKSTQYSVICIR